MEQAAGRRQAEPTALAAAAAVEWGAGDVDASVAASIHMRHMRNASSGAAAATAATTTATTQTHTHIKYT